MIALEGFTDPTLHFLAEEVEDIRGMSYEDGDRLTPGEAGYLYFRLRAKSEDQFPGGKWATIQHLETLIDAFFKVES